MNNDTAQLEMFQRLAIEKPWRVLSLYQPWAYALCVGLKRIETRPWYTKHRGRLYIHATKTMPWFAKAFAAEEVQAGRVPSPLATSCIIGYVNVVEIRPTSELVKTITPLEKRYGDYGPGRFGWLTEDPVLFDDPIPARGFQRIWRFKPQHTRKDSASCLHLPLC